MAEQLKNTLSFFLTPGAQAVIPHGLQTALDIPLAPDIIFIPNPDLSVSSDTVNVTLTNVGSNDSSGSVLVESWHTIERAFGDVANTDLPVKPYIVVSVEAGNQPPQPPFQFENITIFARTFGSDVTGTGTLANPYATMERAVRDIPSNIPPGVRYFVDLTGITENLPMDYRLPAWKASDEVSHNLTNQLFGFVCAVNIQATPQPVALTPSSDATVALTDILSQVLDPVTQLLTVTLNVARASWGANALKGKFAIVDLLSVNPSDNHAVILQNTTTTLVVSKLVVFTSGFVISEPSCTLNVTSTPDAAGDNGGLNANNVDSIAFNGLKVITATAGASFGLCATGTGQTVVQLCEVNDLELTSLSLNLTRLSKSWVRDARCRVGGLIDMRECLFDTIGTWAILNAMYVHVGSCGIFGGATFEFLSQAPGSTRIPSCTNARIENTWIQNIIGATADGVRFAGSKMQFDKVLIDGCGRDGIRCEAGNGFLQVNNVRSNVANGVTTATGVGINVNNGVQVQVDTNTSAAGSGNVLRGAGGNMKVGTGAVRTWANFLSGADGRPVQNEYDITAAAGTGATGTGSRLSQ